MHAKIIQLDLVEEGGKSFITVNSDDGQTTRFDICAAEDLYIGQEIFRRGKPTLNIYDQFNEFYVEGK